MKHLNFLSNLLSLSLGSPCTDVSLDRRFTVGSPSGRYCSGLMRLVFILAILLTVGVGNAWGAETLKTTCVGTGSGYGTRRTTTYDGIGWVLSTGQLDRGTTYLGTNSATNHNKVKPTADDLPVVKAQDASATTSTTGYYFYYTSTAIANVTKIEFSYTAKSGSSTVNAYVVSSSTAASSGSATWSKPTLASGTGLSAQGANIASATGTYTFKLNAKETSSKYYGIILNTTANSRLTSGAIKIYVDDAVAYTVNWTINPAAGGSLSATSGSSTTVTPTSGWRYASPAYTVLTGAASVSQSTNTFTATPTANSTIRINMEEIPSHNIIFNTGGLVSIPNASVLEGATYNITETPAASLTPSCEYGTFVGWTTASTIADASVCPTIITSYTMSTADVTLYAVYSKTTGGGSSPTAYSAGDTGDFVIASYNTSNSKWYAIPQNPTVSSGKIAGVEITVSESGGVYYVTSANATGYTWNIRLNTNGSCCQSLYDAANSKALYHSNGGTSGTNLSYGTSTGYGWDIDAEGDDLTFQGVGISSNTCTTNSRGMLMNGTNFGGYALSNEGASGYYRIQVLPIASAGTTTYSLDANCCNPLGTINGSFSLSSTGTSVTATVTTAGVGAYGDAANVSGYEFKLYTAASGGSASASYSTNSSAGTSHEFTGLDPLTDYWVTVRPIGDGSTYCNTTAESSRVQITTLCVAPNHVDVSGRWDRFGGETISLTATAYSSAGTGSPIDDANITEWKWQKLVSTTWTDLSNGTTDGVTTSGATTKNLQISNCKLNNSGKYRCIISTGATCSTASATATDGTEGFDVKVYVLECYTGGTTVYNFTRVGDTQAGTAQITLAAGSHTFKFHADNIYYGNDGTINEDVTNWVCSTSQGNLTIAAGLGGTFTISMEYSTSGSSSVEGEPEISVTYPRKTIYLTPGVWNTGGAKFAFYYFRKVGETIYGEGFTDFITADDCGSSAEIPLWNGVKINAVRLNSNTIASDLTNSANHYKAAWDKKWNQTGDITITSNNSISITDWGTTDSPYEYGTYAVPTYTISYATGSVPTGGGSISGSKANETKTCGVDFDLPAAQFTTTGYVQTGWSKADGGAQYAAVSGSYTDNSAQTFYPVWTANTHTLTWDKNGGDALTGDYTSGTVAYATAITAPNTPTWTGHTFGGWHNGTSIVTPATAMPDNDLTYTAQWSLASYDVTLNVNGGTINAGNVTSYTYGTGATLPTNVTRDGYRFDGWFSDDGVWSDQVTAISTTATGDKTYYAKWTAIYTVTWHVNGSVYNTGVVSGNSQVISGGKISAPPTAPADNTLSACADKFMGWSEKNAGATAKTTSYYDDLFTDVAGSPTINANKDFYAVFAENNEETKSLTNSEIQTFHTADATTHNSYAKGPFTLTSSDGNWYGVFISQNDGGVYTANVKEAVVTLESTSEKVRPYIMSPTYSDNINSISILATHGSNTSRTLYVCSAATATPASNNIGSITVTKNNSTPQEIIPSSTATTLYLYAAGGAIMIKSIDVSIGSPSNYRTQCDANMVKVTYDANGGSTTCAGGSHDKRNDYTVCSSAPTRDYYTFAGWLCSADSKTYAASATIDDAVIDADFSLTAQWTPVTYNITYNLHGGTTAGGNPTTYDVETATIDLADGTYGHNRFEGWYSTYNDGTGAYSDQVTSIPLGSHGDITLHAKWTTRHEIIFDADGATTTIYRADDEAMDASVAGQGSVPSDPSAPTACSSKVFVGWSESTIDGETDTEPGDLMKPAAGTVDEDKHYYAVWATATPASIPATYAGTGLFKQITRMSQLETGTYYVLRGVNGSTKKAMGNTVSSGKMGCVTDPVSEGVITNPGVAIVWKLGGTKDAYTLYNQDASKYVEITSNSTGGYELKTDASTSYTVTVEDGHGFFFKSNHASANLRGISIYNASEFRSYILSDAKTLELYKMPKTIYTAYSTSCCATKIVLSDPSITDASSSGSTITFDKSSPVFTCDGTKTVTATLTLTAGYQASALSFAVNSGTVSISPAISTPITSSQVYTLTFAEDQNATLTTTATIAAKPLNGITITPSSGEVYVGQYVDFTVSYDPADYINPGYTLNATPVYVTKESAAPANTKLRLKGGRGSGPGASITETVNETVTIKASGDNTKTASVNMTVNPLPRVHFEDLVHSKAFADVAATIEANALSATKTTPTSDDWTTPNANTCEENHLHLVGWIREDWPALVDYLNGTGAAPTTVAITGAGNDGSGNAYFFEPGASINTQTFNGVTFYAVWAQIE